MLGTLVEIDADNGSAVDLAFATVERVHRLMSAHEPDSELSRINRDAHRRPVAVSDWTAAVIQSALDWSRASDGRFDVVRAGRLALASGRLPRHAGQPEPDEADWTTVGVAGGAVKLDTPACLDLGGIAKGFAIDRAIETLHAAGASRGLVIAGGDMRGFGDEPWPVSVVDPLSRRPLLMINLLDMALATSAGVVDEDGSLSFDHLPGGDPRWVSVTVRSPSARDADALTKIAWSGAAVTADLLRNTAAQAFAIRADGQLEVIGAEAQAA